MVGLVINQTALDCAFMVNKWGLGSKVIKQLIGHDISKISSPTHLTMQKIIALTKIYDLLNIMFKDGEESYGQVNNWINQPNKLDPFDGSTPLTYMLDHGYDGMKATEHMLRFWVFGGSG